tara:strand:- start:5479 stop:5724 length:246 start_codon:yes stop_codon:yes gene_type:complete
MKSEKNEQRRKKIKAVKELVDYLSRQIACTGGFASTCTYHTRLELDRVWTILRELERWERAEPKFVEADLPPKLRFLAEDV